MNGGSGGLAVGVNPETNVGYYFELIALTNTNLEDVQGSDDGTGIHNIIFYKVVKNSSSTVDSEKAIPVKLWGGLADIIVDSGQMAGAQSRAGEERSTVYDISVEWKDYSVGVGDVTARRFYLYVNGMQVATVDDISPVPMYSNMALYVRGNSKVMFENIFALRSTVANDMTGSVVGDNMITEAFGNLTLDATSFKNKAINGFVQRSYLSGISSTAGPSHNLYYDEFGTIMREAAYFDIKFDKAYPALLSQVSPVLNGMPGYVVSGYETGPYGAKFLIFNVMDSVLVLDETSGNYLRIQGVAFTQDTTHEYKVDDHFNINSSLSDPTFASDNSILRSPTKAAEKYKDIKINRMKYGLSSWSLQSLYIQTQSVAQDIMDWLVDKTTRQRQLVGVEVFANPLIQLGDVAQISYTRDGVEVFAEASKKFIVYNIRYARDGTGPKMTIYLSEV